MDDFWFNILIEMALLCLLGVLYYFYQKKKILKYEADKEPLVMGYVLQCCLSERGDDPSADIDPVIEALDDYLHNRSASSPKALLSMFIKNQKGTAELREVMQAALDEINGTSQK